MDSEHWISRLAAAKRYYAAQLGHIDDMPGMGMEEVEMEMEDDGDMEMEMEMALGDASWPEVACPYCYEDHDVASLCIHLEEDHPYEPHAADLKEKEDYKEVVQTPDHLPRSLQRSVCHRRRSRFPIIAGHQSQSPQGGGRRGGLTSRRISRVHCLPGASANSSTRDASIETIASNPSKAQIIAKEHLPRD